MYRHKFTAGALVVATGLFYLFLTGFQQSSSTLMTLQSDRGRPRGWAKRRAHSDGRQYGRPAHPVGQIPSSAAFDITDGERCYVGNAVLPDTFKDEALVVLEGEYISQGTPLTPKSFSPSVPQNTRGRTTTATFKQ